MTEEEKKILIDKWAPMVDQPNRNGRAYPSDVIAQILNNQELLNIKNKFDGLV